MFSSGKTTLTIKELFSLISEEELVIRYLGIDCIPCVINSPLREDHNPSFGIYQSRNGSIKFKDLATKESGDILDLLSKIWGLSLSATIQKIINELNNFKQKSKLSAVTQRCSSAKGLIIKEHPEIQVKIREWKKHDLEYWESYGISREWLELADVYPISHKIIKRGSDIYTFGADKYAYAYIEKKEGKVSIKIYQPFNKKGFKWCTSTDKSTISLWCKVPDKGEQICICSSLKDAVCLWANTGIPSIAIQGEGFTISNTAINELKRRFTNIYILLDNDKTGLEDGKKLSESTGFTNLILPKFEGGKDISDLYYTLQDKEKFNQIVLPLFKEQNN